MYITTAKLPLSGDCQMPEFKDFSPKGELLSVRNEPLNETNLERFIKEYSPEFVQGYLTCLTEFLNESDGILYGMHSEHKAFKKMREMSEEKGEFLESDGVKKIIGNKEVADTPQPQR